ncbi:MAG: nickel pincer cofactor biosynthesis protein LarC [Verrucomicrobiota bacterium]|nr:nickel pincer cofactor biosynthesis protein LarC [Verrucomicrobiota bacterium]
MPVPMKGGDVPMRILFLDCFSGISGDMLLGALIDLGVPIELLQEEIGSLGLGGFTIEAIPDSKKHLHGTRFFVHIDPETHGPHASPAAPPAGSLEHEHEHAHEHEHVHDHSHGHVHDHDHAHAHGQGHVHRTLADIQVLIEGSGFSRWTQQRALSVFHRIAVAEGRIHNKPPEQVTFHEVGALDSIVDILLGCRAIEWLGVDRILASVPVAGQGFVECQHGEYPVPSTATLEILKGIPLRQSDHPFELITPTGAGFLAEFVEEFGPFPAMTIEKIGYGIGLRSHHRRPNALRALLGSVYAPSSVSVDDCEHDWVSVLETQVDDQSPELLGPLFETLLQAGALDVTLAPVQMKKQRSGQQITVLTPPELQNDLARLLLKETSAFGIRLSSARRLKLTRFSANVTTRYGEIPVKVGVWRERIETVSPEFEPCRLLAGSEGVSLKAIYQSALAAAEQQGLAPGLPWTTSTT